MRTLITLLIPVLLAGTAFAAPNVTNPTQKGSLLIFPDIRVDNEWNTLVRIQNDGSQDVDVGCSWMDGNNIPSDFYFTITRDQAIWFDARTGFGSQRVQRFPPYFYGAAGLDNPFLVTTGAATEGDPNRLAPGTTGDDVPPFWRGPYLKGPLACWANDGYIEYPAVKWNHLSGTATVYNNTFGAYEYNAYAFFVPTGLDLEPVGFAGTLNLNGDEYDACPLYQMGQFTPISNRGSVTPTPLPDGTNGVSVFANRLVIVGCNLQLNEYYSGYSEDLTFTKLQFDVWNEDEVKFTGAYECAAGWHETTFLSLDNPLAVNGGSGPESLLASGGGIDVGAENFDFATLGTLAARYRVQGVASTDCDKAATSTPPTGKVTTQAVGVLGVQSTFLTTGAGAVVGATGTTLVGAGKTNGRISWYAGGMPEGGIR